MIQHLNPTHPDRLDDYRREEIAIRKALMALRWSARQPEPSAWQPTETQKALTRKKAVALLGGVA